jgi:transposase
MQESNLSAVITTKRRHSAAFKRKILELTEQSGASVAAVALEHGINANLVFKWRKAKLTRKRPSPVTHQPVLLPVSVEVLSQ